jgi:hypothetical protein
MDHHRSSRGEEGRKAQPQTPSADQQLQLQQQTHILQQQHPIIQRNSRPEITDLVEAMHNLRTRKKIVLALTLTSFLCPLSPSLNFLIEK